MILYFHITLKAWLLNMEKNSHMAIKRIYGKQIPAAIGILDVND